MQFYPDLTCSSILGFIEFWNLSLTDVNRLSDLDSVLIRFYNMKDCE